MEPDLLHARQQLLSRAVLGGTAVLLSLLVLAISQHPASASQGGSTPIAITIAALLTFGILSVWTLTPQIRNVQVAILIGTALGALVGAVEIVNIAFEYSSVGSRSIHALAVPLSMAVMVVVLAGAGTIAYQQSFSLKLAVFSGLWCAIVGTLITCIFGFTYSLLFMPHLTQFLQTEILGSGMPDHQAWVVRNTIDSASTHLLLAPVLGAIFSFVGGLLSLQLRARQRSAATMLGVFGILQLAASIALIRFGLTLARPQRAPFISPGMIGAGLALTYFWPVLSALLARRRSGTRGPHDPLGQGVA